MSLSFTVIKSFEYCKNKGGCNGQEGYGDSSHCVVAGLLTLRCCYLALGIFRMGVFVGLGDDCLGGMIGQGDQCL